MKYSGSVKSVVMKKVLLTACVMTLAAVSPGESQFRDFVRVQGDRLVEDGRPFRFISWNIPNLHLVEDYIPFEPPVSATGEPSRNWSGWRLPDRFEITDALATVKDMGGTVVRTYVLSVRRTQDSPDVPRHVLGPGQFNEEAFRTLDQVLQVANEQGVRLIIPFVCNWHWWGGRAEYAGFRGKSKDDFWTDPQLIADLKETIRFVVTRSNTLDRRPVCRRQGHSLLGNRQRIGVPAVRSLVRLPPTSSRSTRNHPVMEGFHGSELREESLAMPEVDIVTTHHYPGMKKSFAQLIRENAARAKGRKPYIVGEFGFVTTQEMTEAIQATVDTQTAGALAWSLRFRNRDGGFYWHSEPSGGNKYKAFHWPGSPIADDYDEVALHATDAATRRLPFADLPVPPLVVPTPPKLLPITDVSAISWQGSVGAQSLRRGAHSHWQKAPGQSSALRWTRASPSTGRSSATSPRCKASGFTAYLRRNGAGVSEPSNVVGPVQVSCSTLVDELADFSRVHSRSGELDIKSRDCRSVMEDAHRAGGQVGSELVYRLESPVIGATVFVFFPKELADLTFSSSADGQEYHPAAAQRRDFPFGAGGLRLLAAGRLPRAARRNHDRYLKFEWSGEAQVSRVEIQHEAATR